MHTSHGESEVIGDMDVVQICMRIFVNQVNWPNLRIYDLEEGRVADQAPNIF